MSAGISLRVDCPAQLLAMERTAYAVPSSRSTQGNLLQTQRRSSEALQWLSPDVRIQTPHCGLPGPALSAGPVHSLQTHLLPAAHSLCSPHMPPFAYSTCQDFSSPGTFTHTGFSTARGWLTLMPQAQLKCHPMPLSAPTFACPHIV